MRVSNRKVAREALTVVQAGRVWSREMDRNQSADAVLSAEGHTDRCESASIGRNSVSGTRSSAQSSLWPRTRCLAALIWNRTEVKDAKQRRGSKTYCEWPCCAEENSGGSESCRAVVDNGKARKGSAQYHSPQEQLWRRLGV